MAVGKNKLSLMVANICCDAGIPRRANHSLCATGATTMFQSKVSETIIQKLQGTGHIRPFVCMRKCLMNSIKLCQNDDEH